MVNQHAQRAWWNLWLLLLHRSLVPSNEALGTRVAIVEVRGDFEPVVQYACQCWSFTLFAVHCLQEFVHVYAAFWDFCLEQMSCKSFLNLQVVIISLDAFQVFCEAGVNTRSPLKASNGSTTACSKTSLPHIHSTQLNS